MSKISLNTMLFFTRMSDYEISVTGRALLKERYAEALADQIIRCVKQNDEKKMMEEFELIELSGCLSEEELNELRRGLKAVAALWAKKPDTIPMTYVMEFYHSDVQEQVKAAKTQTCKQFEMYVYDMIHKKHPEYSKHHMQELFNCGNIGILKAMEKYDPSCGAFTTYSKFFIMHEMSALINFYKKGASVHYNNLQRKINEAIAYLENESFPVTFKTISDITKLKPEIIQREMEVMERAVTVSWDTMENKEEICSTYSNAPETILAERDRNTCFDRAIDAIEDDVIREVMRLKYETSLSVEAIAKTLNVPLNDVRISYQKGLNILKENHEIRSTYSSYIRSTVGNKTAAWSVKLREKNTESESRMDDMERAIDDFCNLGAI